MRSIWLVILCIYGMFGMIMAADSAPDSLISLANTRLSVIWFLPETSYLRLDALLLNGNISLFNLYNQIETLSLCLVLFGALFGLGWGYYQRETHLRLLPVRPLAILIVSFFVLYGLNYFLQMAVDNLAQHGAKIDLGVSAMPLYWVVGLICSAAFTAHYVTLAMHDFALFLRVYFRRIGFNEGA
jgi:hypothetical protein